MLNTLVCHNNEWCLKIVDPDLLLLLLVLLLCCVLIGAADNDTRVLVIVLGEGAGREDGTGRGGKGQRGGEEWG